MKKLNNLKNFAILSAASVLLLNSGNAHAIGIAVVGAGTLSKPALSSNYIDTFSGKVGLGGGALVDFGILPMLSFQVGGLYVTRTYTDTVGAVVITDQLHYLEVPAQFRLMLGRVFSVGLGGYWAVGMGNITQTNGSVTNSNVTYGNFGLKNHDLGLIGSLNAAIPLGAMVQLYAEGQYLYGLQNELTDAAITASPTSSYKNRDIQFLLGLRFGMMGKK